MDGLICDHELESLDGIAVVSRANEAAAVRRISRSSCCVRFSRRSRRTSFCSPVVSPSWRRPASRPACRTQFPMHCTNGSYCRASSSDVRPFRTSATRRWWSSAGYGRWLFDIVDAPTMECPQDRVSSRPRMVARFPRWLGRRGSCFLSGPRRPSASVSKGFCLTLACGGSWPTRRGRGRRSFGGNE